MASILIVDDSPEILTHCKESLIAEGFNVTVVDSGMKALAAINSTGYDCIVLDVMLPDIDGYAICKAVRSFTSAPIIFLSCMDSVDDKIKGLALGADDYITKPDSMRELIARIHVLLRRRHSNEDRQTKVRDIYVDMDDNMIQTPNKNVFLSQKELELFMLLYSNIDIAYTKDELLEALWPKGSAPGAVAVYVQRLRRKLETISDYVGTIVSNYKTGYYMSPPGARRR